MLRKMNRKIKGNLRKLRINFARLLWDRSNGHKIKEVNNFLDENEIKSILFLRADGKIGDMVISSFMFREIKKKYPSIKIGVVTKGGAKDIISVNPYIDKIYDYGDGISSVKKLAKEISKEKYDLLLEFYRKIKPMEIMFVNRCNVKYNMGLNKKDWKLFNISVDENIDLKWDDHVSKRFVGYLKKLKFNSENIDDSYDIFFDEKRLKNLEKFKEQYKNEKIVVLNPFGASKHRKFSEVTIKKILNLLKDRKVIILYHDDKYRFVKEIGDKYENVIIPEGIESILDSAIYISVADIVISPDTSIIHIADCFNKKIIGVYEHDGGMSSAGHKIWGPREKSNHKFVFTPKRKGIYDNFDVNSFNLQDMKEAITNYIK